MIVMVPFRNAWPWLGACLASIAAQVGEFDVVVVDDASDDGYSPYVDAMCSRYGWMYIRNKERLWMPHNLRVALEQPGQADEVVVIVDGDDWLPHQRTLAEIAKVYEDPDVWVTWGSYTRWPDPTFMPNPAQPVPAEVIDERRVRQHPYEFFNHPLCFRRFLFEQVPDSELQEDNGEWFKVGYDKACAFPMVEMAGSKHCRFLPEVRYTYNESNPVSDARAASAECSRVCNLIRSRPPRPRLERT